MEANTETTTDNSQDVEKRVDGMEILRNRRAKRSNIVCDIVLSLCFAAMDIPAAIVFVLSLSEGGKFIDKNTPYSEIVKSVLFHARSVGALGWVLMPFGFSSIAVSSSNSFLLFAKTSYRIVIVRFTN